MIPPQRGVASLTTRSSRSPGRRLAHVDDRSCGLAFRPSQQTDRAGAGMARTANTAISAKMAILAVRAVAASAARKGQFCGFICSNPARPSSRSSSRFRVVGRTTLRPQLRSHGLGLLAALAGHPGRRPPPVPRGYAAPPTPGGATTVSARTTRRNRDSPPSFSGRRYGGQVPPVAGRRWPPCRSRRTSGLNEDRVSRMNVRSCTNRPAGP
jgi:hypothetical protein